MCRVTTLDFDTLVAEHRGELFAHCYRMLGSPQDAEDALQEALLGAWKGYAGFEGRSSVRTWLYTIATNACLKHAKKRVTTPDVGPAFTQVEDLGELDLERHFLEPWATDPEASYLERESVELAYVAALQHLPATQRAVLILREVLQLSAAEVAELLDTTPASVNSALQRARATIDARVSGPSQQSELAALGDDGVRRLVEEFMQAWESADVDRIGAVLAEDVRFTMPPLPAWFAGREMVLRFIAERMFATPWRVHPITVNAQPGFVCEQQVGGAWRPGSVTALTVRDGRVAAISGFIDPSIVEKFLRDR
jgi:RNA polymerase sigma-70 factor (TIGR02960 family)